MTPFKVDTDFYHGPIDLLVLLVQQKEIDVLLLVLGEIARRFVEDIPPESIDIDQAGDFLHCCTILMESKSRELLPHAEESPQELEHDETHQKLIQHLLEYRRFREAAAILAQRASRQQMQLAREAVELTPGDDDPARRPIQDVELWDLVSAFSRLMRENIVPVAEAIEKDPTPLPVYMDRLEGEILREGARGVTFASLLGNRNTRAQIIGKFLAVLELIKTKRVWVDFDADGEVCFYPPRETPLDFEDSSDVMADSSMPPDVFESASPPPEEIESSFSLEQWSDEGGVEIAEPDPDSAWADFEPLDDMDQDDDDAPSAWE